jgi:putative DNA primase/helicase
MPSSKVITQHVNLTPEMANTAALWAAFARALDLGWFNPRLALCSPVKRCGKTTLVEVLSHLVPRAKPTASVTPAVVFRMIDLYQPTYLIDETDAYLPNNEELRAVLNSGHTRTTAKVDRSVKDANGDWVPKSFSTWCPQVVAGIGNLPGTLDNRSIKLRLQRKPRGVKLLRFRADQTAGISDLGRMLARFVLDNQIAIQETDIEPPEELHDRAADNWRPLLAIAAAAGDKWPERAVAAAKALEKLDMDAEDLCVQALADVRDIIQGRRAVHRETRCKTGGRPAPVQPGDHRSVTQHAGTALARM